MYIYVHVYRPLTFYMQKKNFFKLEISKITPPYTPPHAQKKPKNRKMWGDGGYIFFKLMFDSASL